MIRTIPQGDLDINDRIASQNAGLHSTLDTLSLIHIFTVNE